MSMQRTAPEGTTLDDAALADFVQEAFAREALDGKRVLCIIPDSTRSMPAPAMFRAVCAALRPRAAAVDFLIALGTHPPMPQEAIDRMLGLTPEERDGAYAGVNIYNHAWKDPEALTIIGEIDEDEVEAISGGLMRQRVEVEINKRVLDYDLVCIIGPVFPHEVAGFSGGNKYFFPGVAGQAIIDLFHWLGALISNPVINGTKDTPVRRVIDRAASFVQCEKRAFCLDLTGRDCHGIYYGTPEEAWSACANAAASSHIRYCEKPFTSVLAMAPLMYNDIWVAGKCMYKLEPVVADGGELIIYAPHVEKVSVSHGDIIQRIGYHTRDYFLAQWDRFKDIPGGILAHSTHVRGIGTYEDGVETPRVQVTLATGIPEAECHAINLGYRDPASIDPGQWRNREDEGLLLVENAGEILYKLVANNPEPRPFTVEVG